HRAAGRGGGHAGKTCADRGCTPIRLRCRTWRPGRNCPRGASRSSARRANGSAQSRPRAPTRQSKWRSQSTGSPTHGCSLNREMVSRLRASFDKDALRVLDEVAKDLEVSWSRYSERFIRLRINEHLMRAIDNLLTKTDELGRAQGIDALALAIDEVK